MAGRLTYQKNFDLIIDAYENNVDLKNKYKVFILGDGELKSQLKKKLNQKS